MKKNNWNLCADAFDFFDKIKISKFLFTEKKWTYGEWVKKYENKWSQYLGGTPVVMVSSGSTANEMIALRRKWELQQSGDWPKKNKVVAPVNTWISSVTPWIHAGYEIVFSDVSENNFNIYSNHLKEIFAKDKDKEIGTVFYTALLGFFGDLHECKRLTEEHGARFLMDNCEASFSEIYQESKESDENIKLMNFSTSSTSIFYSHFTTSGTEGGLIACETEEEADWFRMFRSHGLTRGMPEKYKNKKVDPMFDFALLGSNYRSSNLQAYMALLDFDRSLEWSENNRFAILEALRNELTSIASDKFTSFNQIEGKVIPLAIPIIAKNKDLRIKAEKFCKENRIETRPIIAGCLCEHTAFKGMCSSRNFPISMKAHRNGFYIGLNKDVTVEMAKELARELSKL